MWSELFFQNLKESLASLLFGRFRYSTNELEYALYYELRSEEYAKYLDHMADVEYPRVEIDFCSTQRRLVLVPNSSVKYEPEHKRLLVCRNLVHSL